MQEYTVEEILSGIRDKDTNVLDFIYKNYYHQIKVFITQNQGSREDAKDIYQDAMLVIFQKLQHDNLKLTCSFNTYLYSVSRLLWLKQLEKRKLWKQYTEDAENFVTLDESILVLYDLNERYKLYQTHFKRLSFSCQKVLELFLARIPLKEIARILGFKSEQYAKKRKHQCKEKLVISIKNDPEFHELSRHTQTNKQYNG
ncbi:MAG TPA: sigma-70 family RNA polymerase sigma factor [Bacteroidales bacterium]|nr:sigma-70 family RNA polymerase sigma factor [Bacteroidales bacterium]HRX96075.1 sigma-70 family RNA polymerase sigma factor [Bacteroidales bacterium]